MENLIKVGIAARLGAVAAFDRLRLRSERGDVPGWVLITIMTAGLVTVLWATARTQLVSMFNTALRNVTGGN